MTRAKGQILFPHITKNIQNSQLGIKDKKGKKEKNLLQRQPRVEITPSKENGINGSPALEHMVSSDNHMIASVSTTTETSTGECNLSWEDEHVDHDDKADHDEITSLTTFNRIKWTRRSEFLMMLVGYTIGLGNVWKFPYLCHKNGGASFLIPYLFFLVVEGMPLYYMELCIGQRFRKGSIGVWHTVSPYLDGIGVASAIICLMVCIYYNVILSWCMVYLVNSFKDPLPWSTCPTYTRITENFTLPDVRTIECELAGPTKYFWYRMTLNISPSIEEGMGINWNLALSLLVAWLICWLCMIRGIRSEGKVVFVTATVPLFLLGIMFFQGVHLKGFQQGLALLFVPKFSKLADPNVWLEAASQTFYSLGIAYGTLIAFSSYNPLKNDTTRDAILLCSIDAGVSIYASVVIFCFIGYRAQIKFDDCLLDHGIQNNTNFNMFSEYFLSDNAEYKSILQIGNVTSNFTCKKQNYLNELSVATGFAFVTFTEALNHLSYPRLWAIFFFLMLLMLGIDTQFGMLEGFVTPLLEIKLLPKIRREISTGIICSVLYVLSLTMVMYSGNYWLQLVENYSSMIPLLVVALAEVLSVSYIYGLDKFGDDIEYMTNKRPHKIWLICWKIVSPFLLIVVLIFSIRNLFTSEHLYNVWDAKEGKIRETHFPPWCIFVGMLTMFVSIMCIPLMALLRYYKILDDAKDKLRLFFSEHSKKSDDLLTKYSLKDQNNDFTTTEL